MLCCILDINLTRKFAVGLSLQIFLIHYIWWSILVTNLATDFEDLLTKVKNLVTLVPVLGTISNLEKKMPLPKSPDRNYSYYIFQGDSDLWQSCTFIPLNVLFKNLDPWGVILWRPATYLVDSRVIEIVENFCRRCTFILSLKEHTKLT